MVSTTTSKNIAITSYKRSRNSHVGIHLWESPTSTTKPDNSNKKNNIIKKQIMIVHIDDHSIFATNTLSNNTELSSSVPTPTLKVGMKLVAVNGIPVTSTTTVNEIYHKLNNAVGYITLLVSTPNLPKDIISPIPNNSTTRNINDTITSPPPMYTDATYLTKSNVLSQERYNIIPKLESINDDDNFDNTSSSSSSTSSSFTSISSVSNNNNNNNTSARSIVINNVNDYDDDDDEDDDELNIYELEKRIRQIWNPILMG